MDGWLVGLCAHTQQPLRSHLLVDKRRAGGAFRGQKGGYQINPRGRLTTSLFVRINSLVGVQRDVYRLMLLDHMWNNLFHYTGSY